MHLIVLFHIFKVYYLFTFFLPHLKHPQTSSPGDSCQDDRLISGEQSYSSGALGHKDLPDSLMKVGAHSSKQSSVCSLLSSVFEFEISYVL